jgi:hypothetical protein
MNIEFIFSIYRVVLSKLTDVDIYIILGVLLLL